MAIQSRFLSFILVCSVGIVGPPAAAALTMETVLAPSRELPDFSLINQQGKLFGSAGLRGRSDLQRLVSGRRVSGGRA